MFSCTKLSPFMGDLYKFSEVQSNTNVKFCSSSKVIKDTPRGLKRFKYQQNLKKATLGFIDKVAKKDKREREN